ncbi:MAG TPA: threonine synthase [Pyrinomonadaceae bacterium]|nr:threonine synthase [Pyrinomonadaceae bacterium]
MNVTHLECGLCGLEHEARRLHNLCRNCGKPLLVRYDLTRSKTTLTKESLASRRADMWRYREVLPVESDANIVSLGEGWTPLLRAKKLGKAVGVHELYIKDESQNPTQSFKARGMSAAVSMAKELGAKKLAVPSAGNAAGALAAYAARAGLKAFIFMPRDTPRANIVECEQTGAEVTLMDGLITDCGAEVARRKDAARWFDVSTLKEPYRVEGKKTLGYELAEQMNWELPDVIIYPTGGGTGLIGMWKAFAEMQEMGWIGSKRPRMVTVQAEGCAPIVRAFEQGNRFADEFPNAATTASGLRVPKAIGDFLILDALRQSGGAAVAVTDEELIAATREIGAAEGIFCAPEGAACLPALRLLVEDGFVNPADRVVLFNTGAGVKYIESFTTAGPAEDKDLISEA